MQLQGKLPNQKILVKSFYKKILPKTCFRSIYKALLGENKDFIVETFKKYFEVPTNKLAKAFKKIRGTKTVKEMYKEAKSQSNKNWLSAKAKVNQEKAKALKEKSSEERAKEEAAAKAKKDKGFWSGILGRISEFKKIVTFEQGVAKRSFEGQQEIGEIEATLNPVTEKENNSSDEKENI